MSVCSRCGAVFSCGMVDGPDGDAGEPCWCATLPVVTPDVLVALGGGVDGGSCFCPACLGAVALPADQT